MATNPDLKSIVDAYMRERVNQYQKDIFSAMGLDSSAFYQHPPFDGTKRTSSVYNANTHTFERDPREARRTSEHYQRVYSGFANGSRR